MSHKIRSNKIGIVGGGQLGRMLALAAIPLGFEVTVLDPNLDCPASVCAKQIVGSFKDAAAIKQLAANVDFMTFEIESANAQALTQLAADGKRINPTPTMLSLIKDKYAQKLFYQKHKIPTAFSLAVNSIAEVQAAAEKINYPFLLKARFDAYDGRGNALIKSPEQITAAFTKLGGQHLYVEQFVPFVKELAIMVARDQHGNIKSYPVVETIHENNICHTVIAPAQVDAAVTKAAKQFAEQTVAHLEGAGVFGVEMFVTADGNILINEIAPRVHNSGHYTTEACVTSQFEQHIRAISGLPLGNTDLKVPAVVMMNLLGAPDAPAECAGLDQALAIPGVSVHLYGKKQSKPERKMGHLTAIGASLDEAYQRALQAKEQIQI
jgi:phosphoribosylaminoimidazole carboxylase PurK protein